MLPLSDGLPARFPVVTVTLIVANFAVAVLCRTSTRRSSTPRSTRAPWTAPAGAISVGPELDHRHVPARRLGPHPGQHAVPGDLRQERRGRLRAGPLPDLLLRRRLRGDADSD